MSAGALAAPKSRLFADFLRRNFYFTMALVISASIVYGFAQTFAAGIIHPPYPRPWILHLHAIAFSTWLAIFIAQTALIRNRNVRLHRTLGTFGLAFGAMIPVVALAVSLTMDRLDIQHSLMHHPQFLAIQLNDIVGFSVLFALAALLRRKPEYHRRLMFLAICYLTDAGFDRWPMFGPIFERSATLGFAVTYLVVDTLVLCGIARDWIVDRKVGVVYRYALPFFFATQATALTLYAAAPAWWVALCHTLIGA